MRNDAWFRVPVPQDLFVWISRRYIRSRIAALSAALANDESPDGEPKIGFHDQPLLPNHTASLNSEQKREVTVGFFSQFLGPSLKYSCSMWNMCSGGLRRAELETMQLYADRAQVRDGMRVLDLGCGWGSFSLWLASSHANCQVVALTNSVAQGQYVEQAASELGLANITVVVANAETLQSTAKFDRIFAIELIEQVHDRQDFLARVSKCLAAQGKLFVHSYCHSDLSFRFEPDSNIGLLMGMFFCNDRVAGRRSMSNTQDALAIESEWYHSGQNYQVTAEHWQRNLASNRKEAISALLESNPRDSRSAHRRWLFFLIVCQELFGSNNGKDWLIAHYLMRPS